MQYVPMWHARGACVCVVVTVLLRNFTTLHGFRKESVPITAARDRVARTHTQKKRESLVKIGWEPFPWVHWMVAHSATLLKKYGSLHTCSSMPSKHRDKTF